VDVNKLRSLLDDLGADTLTPLSEEKLKELEKKIETAQATATKALKRPSGGRHDTRMMC